MKKYIIFTHTIYNLGGGQLLTLRKKKILESLGYEILVVYKKKRGPFLLEKEFNDIKNIYVPEFDSPLNIISSSSQNKCIENVTNFIGSVTQDSIIESNDRTTAVWAEIIAQRAHIRHIYYLIIETELNSYKFYPYKSFFEFKLKRKELWACNSKGLEISFKRMLPEYSDMYINVPYDTSEIAEMTEPTIDYGKWKENNKIVITTISRLDKNYVIDLFKAVRNICDSHREYNIELIIVGDTVVGNNKQWLKEQVDILPSNTPNMNVIMPGYIKSIGKDFFNHTNVFVGMGTAIISAISQGCVSLTVNPYNSLSSGILGIDTYNFAFNDNGKEFSLKEKIEDILEIDRDLLKDKILKFYHNNYTLEAYKRKYKMLLENCESQLEYYDFSKRKNYQIFDNLASWLIDIKEKL